MSGVRLTEAEIADIGHGLSEWLDDDAPLNERLADPAQLCFEIHGPEVGETRETLTPCPPCEGYAALIRAALDPMPPPALAQTDERQA